jgi:hypothetical protein
MGNSASIKPNGQSQSNSAGVVNKAQQPSNTKFVPAALTLTGGKINPKLNGDYKLMKEVTCQGEPAYGNSDGSKVICLVDKSWGVRSNGQIGMTSSFAFTDGVDLEAPGIKFQVYDFTTKVWSVDDSLVMTVSTKIAQKEYPVVIAKPPMTLAVSGGTVFPDLNGTYELVGILKCEGRPVYEQKNGAKKAIFYCAGEWRLSTRAGIGKPACHGFYKGEQLDNASGNFTVYNATTKKYVPDPALRFVVSDIVSSIPKAAAPAGQTKAAAPVAASSAGNSIVPEPMGIKSTIALKEEKTSDSSHFLRMAKEFLQARQSLESLWFTDPKRG